jgi:hypothetical protein
MEIAKSASTHFTVASLIGCKKGGRCPQRAAIDCAARMPERTQKNLMKLQVTILDTVETRIGGDPQPNNPLKT